MRHLNGKPIRTRGTGSRQRAEQQRQKDIHSKIDGLPSGTHKGHAHSMHGSSATAAVESAAIFFECAMVEETAEQFVIPRQSVTRQQMLDVFPQSLEFEPKRSRQLDKRHYERTGEVKLVETTDQRLSWKSDKTLLRKNNPFAAPDDFKRAGQVSVGLNTRKFTEHTPEPATDKSEALPVLPEGSVYMGDE